MSFNKDNLVELDHLKKMALESVLTEDQAIKLLNHQIKDAWLLKLRIDLENKTGVLVCLISKFRENILQIFSVFGNSPTITRIRTFEDQHQILGDMIEALKTGTHDKGVSETIGRVIYRTFDKESLQKLMPEWEKHDKDNTTIHLENSISQNMKTKNIQIQMDVEAISSIEFRTNNPLAAKISPVINPLLDLPSNNSGSGTSQTSTPSSTATSPTTSGSLPTVPEKSDVDRKIEELEAGFSRIISCKTVLAPAHGIEFSQLKKNQKLLFQLPFKTEADKETAKRLDAVSDKGELKPIIGDFFQIIEGKKNEYHIYARGPYGVLLRAFEERPVRIAIPKDEKNLSDDVKSFSYFLYAALGGIFIVVLLLILYFYNN
jgi:hypothetical protein